MTNPTYPTYPTYPTPHPTYPTKETPSDISTYPEISGVSESTNSGGSGHTPIGVSGYPVVEEAPIFTDTEVEEIERLKLREHEEAVRQSLAGWIPLTVEDVLSGHWRRPEPEVLRRTDGKALLYRGMVNGIHGAAESAKSWAGLLASVQELSQERSVVYLDFESTAGTIVSRLLRMGTAHASIREHFYYLNPLRIPIRDDGSEAAERDRPARDAMWRVLRDTRPTLIVVDASTSYLNAANVDQLNAQEVAGAYGFLREIAVGSGAAVLVIDHVTKLDSGNAANARFAAGSYAKLAQIDGAEYAADVITQPRPGDKGEVRLTNVKDREGAVREFALPAEGRDPRAQVAAILVLDSATDPSATYARLEPPTKAKAPDVEWQKFGKLSPGYYTVTELLSAFGLKDTEYTRKAVKERMKARIADGLVEMETRGTANVYRLTDMSWELLRLAAEATE